MQSSKEAACTEANIKSIKPEKFVEQEEERESIEEPANQEIQKISPSQHFYAPKLYTYRWIILILYLLGDFIPSIIATSTTPIASQLTQIYSLQPIEVNLSTLVILIISPFATIFSSKFIDENGLSMSIRLGSIICIGGAWLRVLVNYNFFFVVAGNLLTGIGGPLIFNGKTQVASNWFSHQQGPGITGLISFWVNLNYICGFAFSGNFVGDYKYDANKVQDGRNLIWKLMIITALGVSGIGVLIWIFFKQKPLTPPSFTAQIEREHNFKETVKKLLRNRNYIFLILQQGLFLGSMSGLSTAISYFISPFGFDSQDSTMMLGSIPIGGVIGILISSYFLNKYKMYKLQLGICSLGGAGGLFFMVIMFYTEKLFLVVISTGIVGIFFLPMIPIILEFACESVFPIGEGSTVGFLSLMNNLFALLYGGIVSFIVRGESKGQSFIGITILIVSFGLGFLLLFLTTENLVRHKTEQLKQAMFTSSESENSGDIQLTNMSSITQQLQERESQESYTSTNDNNITVSSYQSPIKHFQQNQDNPWTIAISIQNNESITNTQGPNTIKHQVKNNDELDSHQKHQDVKPKSDEEISNASTSEYSAETITRSGLGSSEFPRKDDQQNIFRFSTISSINMSKDESQASNFSSTSVQLDRKQVILNLDQKQKGEELETEEASQIQIDSPTNAVSQRLKF